jgi:hypothetical protein
MQNLRILGPLVRDITGAGMVTQIPAKSLVNWSLITIMRNTMPPRDPNDDDDNEDNEDDDDEEDKDEPAVIREPDEGE